MECFPSDTLTEAITPIIRQPLRFSGAYRLWPNERDIGHPFRDSRQTAQPQTHYPMVVSPVELR